MRYLLLILILASCATDKSATKYFDKHPDKGSGYCAAKYPVHVGEAKVSEQDWSDTTIVGAIDSNSFGQLAAYGIYTDSAITIPTRIINHYHKITDSIPYIDSALAHNLRLQLGNALQTNTTLQNTMIANNKAANAKYDASESKRKMWMWIAIGLGAAFLGFRKIFGIFFNK